MHYHAQRACDTAIPSRGPAQGTPADTTACCDAAITTPQSSTQVPATSDAERALRVVSEPRAAAAGRCGRPQQVCPTARGGADERDIRAPPVADREVLIRISCRWL